MAVVEGPMNQQNRPERLGVVSGSSLSSGMNDEL